MNTKRKKISNGVIFPNFNEEKKLWRRGIKFVAGLDEAGRGPLAGPVVASAVIIKNYDPKIFTKDFGGINDSKKVSENQRECLYKILTSHKNVEWGVGIVSEKVIDKINILQATKLAMQKALRQAQGKPNKNIEYLLIDGNFKIDTSRLRSSSFGEPRQKSIIKGDQKVFSISAASIIAKVTRDRIMEKYHKKYPQYEFAKHKGYGTALHMQKIREFGLCKIHRKSFNINFN